VPNNGSQMVMVCSPIHKDGLIGFKYDPEQKKWKFLDTDPDSDHPPFSISEMLTVEIT